MSYKIYRALILSVGLLALVGCVSHDNTDKTPLPANNSIESSPAFKIKKGTSPYGLPGDKVFTQFPAKRVPTGNKVLIIDPTIPAWAAYNAEGNLVKTGKASAGKDYCPDTGHACRTVTGKFTVYSEKGSTCKSSRFPLETHGGAPMPYCMHFYKGYALHGAYDVPDYNASHGCVRLIPTSAKWLSQSFVDIGTTVIILPYKNKGSAERNGTKKKVT